MNQLSKLIAKNKLSEALDILLVEVKNDPNSFELNYLLQGVYYLNGDYENCYNQLIKIEKNFPNKKLTEIRVLKEICYRQIKNLPKLIYNEEGPFLEVLSKVENKTLLGIQSLFNLFQLLKQAKSVHGDMAEVGVYKGGTAYLMLKESASTNKKVHLFDTFSGMPKTNEAIDLHKEGDFKDTSMKQCQLFLSEFSNAEFYPGIFPETASPIKNKRFSFVHVDCDIYSSVKESCEFFYPRLEKSGILLFDDYGIPSCPGAKKAVDEFFKDKLEYPIYYTSGQCSIIKL